MPAIACRVCKWNSEFEEDLHNMLLESGPLQELGKFTVKNKMKQTLTRAAISRVWR